MLIEWLDFIPVCLAFSMPQMPVGNAPTAPSVSAEAEKQRQAAAQAAQIAATAGGRSSTIRAGTGAAYEKQRALMQGSASSALMG